MKTVNRRPGVKGHVNMLAPLLSDERTEYRVTIALNPFGRAVMARDMELIRKIISEIQSWPDVKPRILTIEGYDPSIVGRHVEMLIKADLIEGKPHPSGRSTKIDAVVTDLTYEGHDFAAAI